jgi:arabinan endo-1,5-alpha-L-arabinosidase
MLVGCEEPNMSCEFNENIVNLASNASPIHDPAMIKMDDTYYVYSSSALGSFYTSPDMRNWTFAEDIFEEIPSWLSEAIPGADHIGAPDISYYDGRYVLFYQSHQSDTCNAATGLATNQSLNPEDIDYKWTDHGLVLRSKPFVEGIDVLCGGGDSIYNAIDAHLFQDNDGTPWLAFGSTIGGIKIVELDPVTLKPPADAEFITLAQRFLLQEDPIIEAPYIIYRHGFYYLFISYNHCCRGENTRYQVRVGRSEKVTGPYYDREGWPLYWEGGTLIIDKDGFLVGTGHSNVFSEGGVDWLVHHAKDSRQGYKPLLNIRKIEWDEQHWPSVCKL